jgi:hypothetical protein
MKLGFILIPDTPPHANLYFSSQVSRVCGNRGGGEVLVLAHLEEVLSSGMEVTDPRVVNPRGGRNSSSVMSAGSEEESSDGVGPFLWVEPMTEADIVVRGTA